MKNKLDLGGKVYYRKRGVWYRDSKHKKVVSTNALNQYLDNEYTHREAILKTVKYEGELKIINEVINVEGKSYIRQEIGYEDEEGYSLTWLREDRSQIDSPRHIQLLNTCWKAAQIQKLEAHAAYWYTQFVRD